MKLRSLLLTALLGLGTLAPINSASASCERTRVTYDCNGHAIYWVYQVVGYDCHGCPRYSWVRSCPPTRYDRDDDDYGYSHHHHDDDDYGYRSSPRSHCDSGGYRGSRAGFFFGFGR